MSTNSGWSGDWGFCDVEGCQNAVSIAVEGGFLLCLEHAKPVTR